MTQGGDHGREKAHADHDPESSAAPAVALTAPAARAGRGATRQPTNREASWSPASPSRTPQRAARALNAATFDVRRYLPALSGRSGVIRPKLMGQGLQ